MSEGYEQDIDIAGVYTHASYGLAASHDRDIAVIKLASPAKSNSHVGPVCLQSSNADFSPGTYNVQSQSPPLSSVVIVMREKATGETLSGVILLQRKKLLSSFQYVKLRYSSTASCRAFSV